MAQGRQMGLLTFNWLTEQGSLGYDGREYTIRKHGPMSGRWTLEEDGGVQCDAQKPSALFREFVIQTGSAEFTSMAQSPFGRSYDLLSGGARVGTIEPAHPFTRRAVIDCDASISERDQLFAFWLAALTWKRAANNAAAASASH
jgi:hypothetical protein